MSANIRPVSSIGGVIPPAAEVWVLQRSPLQHLIHPPLFEMPHVDSTLDNRQPRVHVFDDFSYKVYNEIKRREQRIN